MKSFNYNFVIRAASGKLGEFAKAVEVKFILLLFLSVLLFLSLFHHSSHSFLVQMARNLDEFWPSAYVC